MDLVNHGMVRNTKTWSSWKQSITFVWDKKILNQCLILRSLPFVAEVTFNILPLIWMGGIPLFRIGFPLITQELQKLWPGYFAAISNISLEAFVSKLVSLACSSLKILGKTYTMVFPIARFLLNLLLTKIVRTPEPEMILTWNLVL